MLVVQCVIKELYRDRATAEQMPLVP